MVSWGKYNVQVRNFRGMKGARLGVGGMLKIHIYMWSSKSCVRSTIRCLYSYPCTNLSYVVQTVVIRWGAHG
jgi:hypothetical protein